MLKDNAWNPAGRKLVNEERPNVTVARNKRGETMPYLETFSTFSLLLLRPRLFATSRPSGGDEYEIQLKRNRCDEVEYAPQPDASVYIFFPREEINRNRYRVAPTTETQASYFKPSCLDSDAYSINQQTSTPVNLTRRNIYVNEGNFFPPTIFIPSEIALNIAFISSSDISARINNVNR